MQSRGDPSKIENLLPPPNAREEMILKKRKLGGNQLPYNAFEFSLNVFTAPLTYDILECETELRSFVAKHNKNN